MAGKDRMDLMDVTALIAPVLWHCSDTPLPSTAIRHIGLCLWQTLCPTLTLLWIYSEELRSIGLIGGIGGIVSIESHIESNIESIASVESSDGTAIRQRSQS